MCGIVGVFGAEPICELDRCEVRAAAELMRRRGPDGSGFEEGQAWYFGHRRLAVMDPTEGQQPWVDPKTGNVLVYNGEIYNFRALRSELRELGHCFSTDCDTEVVAVAYAAWGRDCVQRFNGMFAFALYDKQQDALWLVRDRLGVKPLYYHQTRGRLRFASSVAALFAFKAVERRIDPGALWHYLRTIRTTLGSSSLVRNVSLLEPGQMLWWQRSVSSPQIQNYWELPLRAEAISELKDYDLREAAEEARQRVTAAVHAQLVSDVPLGGFLSGGLDSSILTGIVAGERNAQFGTCSVGYAQEGFNEWHSIREAADYHQVENEEIHLRGDTFADDWQVLIGEKGLPLSTPNEVPIRHLAKGFGRRFKVALSGEGADEIFGGYTGPTFCAFDYDRSNGHGAVRAEALRRWYGVEAFSGRMEHFFRVNSWLDEQRTCALLQPALGREAAGLMHSYYTELFRWTEGCSTFDAYLRTHLRVNLEGLLNRLDSSTMAVSVEGRVPFTDHHLVEWVFAQPDAAKMALCGIEASSVSQFNSFELSNQGHIETKRLLRHGFVGRVPSRVLTRPKVSFPVPFAAWFAGELQPLLAEAFSPNSSLAELLDPATLSDLSRNAAADPMVAWPLVNLWLWQRRFGLSL